MNLRVIRVALAVTAGIAAQSASGAQSSGPTAEQAALSQCVVMRTTGADRVLTAQWMFAAIARSPQIADLAAVTDQTKIELDKAFALLLTRIVTKDCFEQMRPLAAQDFEDAFELVGGALGKVAMQELMGNEKVDKAIGAYTDYLSEKDFKQLVDSIGNGQSK